MKDLMITIMCKASFFKESLTSKMQKYPFLSLLLIAVALFYSEYSFAKIAGVTDLKGLSKTVETEIQSNGIPIILNAAGITSAAFALITQRWMMLVLGAAYLIFINVFFGYVNTNFKAS